MKETYTGINIQFPISSLIVSGKKTIETRTYPIPSHLVGKKLLLIETPGASRAFKARIVAEITFGSCFRYRSRIQFYKDIARHHVSPDSDWAWDDSKPKWGWNITSLKSLRSPKALPGKKGIRFTTGLTI